MNSKLAWKIFLAGITILSVPLFAEATIEDFNVDPAYDYLGRESVKALLYQIGDNANFFVEQDYYDKMTPEKKQEFSDSLRALSVEFDQVIYPKVTTAFGSEWKPGIDKDDKITVLLTQIKGENGGYFNPDDEYPLAQVETSNEREMVYLNVSYLNDFNSFRAYLAHEFVHLITFNQKERNYGVQEETWLNEMRAELIPTILGYYDEYSGSILQRRVRDFANKPDDSLTEWRNTAADYPVITMFGHYLLDHYGQKVLKNSLFSDSVGIASLNEALEGLGFQKDFSQIFSDWLITLFVNDCSVGQNYCYLNKNLKNLKIIPQLSYLPSVGESTLTVTDYAKDWSGTWIKFIGGQGTLKVDFIGNEKTKYMVPYVTQDNSGNYSVAFLNLGTLQRGTIYVQDFGKKYNSLTIIPNVQKKTSGFAEVEPYYQFLWSASIINENPDQEEELIAQLLVQIEYLKTEIAKIQAQIAAILGNGGGTSVSCQSFETDLYLGMTGNAQVKCLQSFLKSQGTDIYPEGIVNGNFYSLTIQAVIRFQEKYASAILTPVGLVGGTGYFGPRTRQVANSLLQK